MISKRTGIILIIAIVVILIFETNFGLDKINEKLNNIDHTDAQITLKIDGEIVDLKGVEVTYNCVGTEKPLTAAFSKLNETGYENIQNNSVVFNPCGKGSNKLTFTIPKELINVYSNDLKVDFGFENNQSEFNSYSLIINLTTTDDTNIKADITQTVYYPDENGNALNKKAENSTIINSENSTINCIIK